MPSSICVSVVVDPASATRDGCGRVGVGLRINKVLLLRIGEGNAR